MTILSKRGSVYCFDFMSNGRRLRGSLGTRLPAAAKTLLRQIEQARAEGPTSALWTTLRSVLPPASFEKISSGFRLTASPALSEFETRFLAHLDRRVCLGELADSSRKLYTWASSVFFSRMAERRVRKMDEVTAEVVDRYLCWRREAVLAQGKSGRGLVTETTVLQAIFNFAVEEGTLKSSPLRHRYRPDSDPKGPDPFTPEEIAKLDAAATGPSRLIFLLFRFTGLRGSDVAALTWGAADLNNRTLRWQTKKRGKWVNIPLVLELYDRLVWETGGVGFTMEDKIIPGATRAKLYKTIKELGEKAEVPNCHPHRFRHYLAAELLGRGASLFDVSALLGDSHGVVERFYASTTDKQQERIRGIMEQSG
jgi:integrase/recombinase XerD